MQSPMAFPSKFNSLEISFHCYRIPDHYIATMFTHDTTAVLSYTKMVAINSLECQEQNEISAKFELWWKNSWWNGPQRRTAYRVCVSHRLSEVISWSSHLRSRVYATSGHVTHSFIHSWTRMRLSDSTPHTLCIHCCGFCDDKNTHALTCVIQTVCGILAPKFTESHSMVTLIILYTWQRFTESSILCIIKVS